MPISFGRDILLKLKSAGIVPSTANPTIASTVFDALQQDALWTQDSATNPGTDGLWGYNFKFVVPAAAFANSGDKFQVDGKFTPLSGENFVVTYTIPTLKVYTS